MVLTLEYFMYFMYILVCEQMCHVMINLFISLTNICKMIIGYASPHLLNATAEKTCYINHMEEWREGGQYLIFVMNAVNAVRVKFLAECKKTPEEPEKDCFWQFCHKFTHFLSVKFS